MLIMFEELGGYFFLFAIHLVITCIRALLLKKFTEVIDKFL